MKRMSYAVWMILALLGAARSPSGAEEITFWFQGEVTNSQTDMVAPGDRISGCYTFESTAVDVWPDNPVMGYYQPAIRSLTLTLGENSLSADGGDILVVNDYYPSDVEQYDNYEVAVSDLQGGGGEQWMSFQLYSVGPLV
jgi:hypothetical protein